MAEPGLIQVYTGDGKGKTTAAVGLAVRALGHGRRVLLARFLKAGSPPSGELRILQGIPGLEILGSGASGLRPDGKTADATANLFAAVVERVDRGGVDLVILDEVNNALHRGYLDATDLLDFLRGRPPGLEVVLTGRNAPAEVLDLADLVTVMEARRHPLRAGVAARPGIEY